MSGYSVSPTLASYTPAYVSAPKVAVSKVVAAPAITTYSSGPAISSVTVAPTIASYSSPVIATPTKLAYTAPAYSGYSSALGYSAYTPAVAKTVVTAAPVYSQPGYLIVSVLYKFYFIVIHF